MTRGGTHRGKGGSGGFSSLILLFAIALLGLGLATAGTLWSQGAQRDREQDLLFAGRQIRQAITDYHDKVPAGQQNKFPAKLEDLLKDSRWPTTTRQLRRIYIDPMTGNADWVLVAAPGGGIMGVHSRSTAAPIKHIGFQKTEESFVGVGSVSDWVFLYNEAGNSAVQ